MIRSRRKLKYKILNKIKIAKSLKAMSVMEFIKHIMPNAVFASGQENLYRSEEIRRHTIKMMWQADIDRREASKQQQMQPYNKWLQEQKARRNIDIGGQLYDSCDTDIWKEHAKPM